MTNVYFRLPFILLLLLYIYIIFIFNVQRLFNFKIQNQLASEITASWVCMLVIPTWYSMLYVRKSQVFYHLFFAMPPNQNHTKISYRFFLLYFCVLCATLRLCYVCECFRCVLCSLDSIHIHIVSVQWKINENVSFIHTYTKKPKYPG